MVGNHRDAWTYGAVDPSSGTAATLEACRALGEAYEGRLAAAPDARLRELGRRGIRPRRLDRVGRRARRGDRCKGPDDAQRRLRRLRARPRPRRGSPRSATSSSPPPPTWTTQQTGRPLRDVWTDRSARTGRSPCGSISPTSSTIPTAELALPAFSPRLGDLGSGSDYTAFVDHLGIPALNVDFSGRYGVYHSIYDDFFWMDHFGDPGFALHTTAARSSTP